MKAIAITGKPELDQAFVEREEPKPAPGPRDLLVKIQAISVNPVDTKIRRSATESKVIGWDAVGVVETLGEQARGFAIGDQVYYAGDVSRPGSDAEYQCVDARLVAKAPESLEIEEAAALPLTALTAWEGLFDVLGLEPRDAPRPAAQAGEGRAQETLLVINGAGGVGSMVIQLAKQLTDLRVIATASREMSVEWCKEMGADLVVDHHQLVEALAAEGVEQVDYIYCCHDIGDHWDNMAKLIRPFGRIVAIAETKKQVDVNALQIKAASFAWELMFARALHGYFPERQGEILARLAKLIDAGRLRSTLSEVIGPLNIDNLAEAHRRLESGHAIGKLVLTVAD
ncbi:zinc-binding alcohol dehydrogenase family protein [Halotalea alkalilenta]|uniref:zinc-binding alcohol dehydrogenase family protein n=1 Tax=Halotalea alkalilenta TaxID=376489 RepID=UPI000482354A|nr:zinc-binding alcohol dehydrogenase family protein [Halotalea alkalilenta]